MEEQVNRLAQKTWGKYQQTPPDQRLLIAVSGIPGSGKTTLAIHVTASLNALPSSASIPIATFISMDGYHLSRAQLSALPDPDTAHARRGAAFTFDGDSFLSLVRLLRQPISPDTPVHYAPSFEHAVKDPVADDIAIPATARIVIFEGNYLSLNKTPWKEAAGLMDELWFVQVEEGRAKERLVERHVRTGVTADGESAARRAEENDLPNGREIVEGRLDVHEVIESMEDERWSPEAQGFEGG